MAIIVEDGTGVVNANSFVSEADADTYHLLMGNAEWAAATSPDKQAALARAGRYLNGQNWLGRKVKFDSAMSWPRREVPNPDYPEDSGTQDGQYLSESKIPTAVKNAQYELAYRELLVKDSTAPDLERGGAVLSEKIGDIEITYSPSASASTVMQTVNMWLAPLLISSNNSRIVLG